MKKVIAWVNWIESTAFDTSYIRVLKECEVLQEFSNTVYVKFKDTLTERRMHIPKRDILDVIKEGK